MAETKDFPPPTCAECKHGLFPDIPNSYIGVCDPLSIQIHVSDSACDGFTPAVSDANKMEGESK